MPLLKQRLDAFATTFDYVNSRAMDPVRFVHRWPPGVEQEIISLYAALLAYGRADVLGRAINDAVERMGAAPLEAIKADTVDDAIHRFSDSCTESREALISHDYGVD